MGQYPGRPAAPMPPLVEVLDWRPPEHPYQLQWLGVPGHDAEGWTRDADLPGTITELTVHWSEAYIAENLSDEAYIRAVYQIALYHYQKNWAAAGQPPAYGDGCMYHYVLAPNGLLLRTRPETRRTWNARSANTRNLAICVLAGKGNKATAVAAARLRAFLDAMCYGRSDLPLVTALPETVSFGGRLVKTFGVLTHDESLRIQGQPTKGCCGDEYTAVVRQWRAAQPTISLLFAPDQPVAGPATISPEVFAAQLARRNSPILAEASALEFYQSIDEAGINPAVALAFFGKESEFGSYEHSGESLAPARNWGNLRPTAALYGQEGSLATGVFASRDSWQFASFPSWMAGCRAWCEYMKRRFPGQTVAGLLDAYAPITDGNKPAIYAATVNNWVADWQQASAAQKAA